MAKIFYTLLFLNVNELKLKVQFSFALPTPDALGSRRGKGHLLGQCSSEQHGRAGNFQELLCFLMTQSVGHGAAPWAPPGSQRETGASPAGSEPVF